MPTGNGRVPKGKSKTKQKEENDVARAVDEDVDMDDVECADDVDVEGKDYDVEDDEKNSWQTKAELEAIEAEINAESLVLTRAKSSREPPSSLVLPLLPYQKEFLAWAIDQETGPVRGGILADEMGLGKTLQAVSLIVTHPREGQILGPHTGAPVVSTVKTAARPTMKLKLPNHLSSRESKADHEKLTSEARGGDFHTKGAERSQPGTNGRSECHAHDHDAQADGTGAVIPVQNLGSLSQPQVTENAEARPPAAGTVKAMKGEGDAMNADSPATKSEPQTSKVSKAKAKKPRATKSGAKGKASGAEAANKKVPQTPEKAAPDTENDAPEGDGATPASGNSGSSKTKKSSKAKAKAKKPRTDPMLAAMEQAKTCRVEEEDGGDQAFSNTTLVVSPVVAAMQWRQEILRYMAPGSVNVVLYHGTNRADTFTRKQLEAADIVLTTYSILEVDYRRNVMAPKATCAYCGKKFQPERLKVHLRYFCGPWAEKTEAQARQEKKRMPWMYGGSGGGGGKGKAAGKGGKDASKSKSKGSSGASTSAAAQAAAEGDDEDAAALEDGVEAEEQAEEDAEMEDASDDGQAGKRKGKTKTASAKTKTKTAGKKASAAATGSGKAGSKKAKDDVAGPSPRAQKATRRRPAAKKQKTAAAQDIADAPAASGSDNAADAEPPTESRQAARWAGKVTRSRAASYAATAATTPDMAPTDTTAAEEPAKPARKTRNKPAALVGTKRKRAAASKPAPKKGRTAAKKGCGGRRGGDDSSSDGSGTDWAPESEDEAQAAMDAEVSDSELSEEAAALSDGTVTAQEEEEEEDLVEVEEPRGKGKGTGKGKGKRKKGEVDEEELQLEREVEAAAAKMIAKAQKERDKQVQGQSLLHQIRWRRVVLDEAHCIKDRRCNTAQSAFALTARYRWCLTGTPLQNRVNELYSLIRFLRLHPFSHYFCDKTKCCSLDFPFKNDLRRCDLCGGSRMSHYCWWNRRIANPIKYNGYDGRGRTAMLILKHQILPKVLLRRTKLMCAADLALPPRTVVLRKDPFDRQEEDFYEALYTQSQAAFGGYVESGTLLNNYAHIFDLLIRLRQAVNHPYLVVYSATGGRNDSLAALPGAPDADDVVADATKDGAPQPLLGMCGICHDPLEDGIAAACGHSFCRVCVTEYLDNSVGATDCPTCQRPLTIDLTAPSTAAADAPPPENGGGRVEKFKKRSILNRINTRAFQSSTKLEALNEAIQRMLAADPSAKCIVFSQFTSMLDLANFRLQQTGVRCVRLEGSMTLDMRNRMIKSFNEDPNVTCFLMSLKAGGVALNLTVASNVMLMDPWWNPAVEQQAQDRIHRLGQYKPITVTRFVIAGTIEERILKLQEKKRLVFEGTVGRDAEALGKLTVDDLRFLFG